MRVRVADVEAWPALEIIERAWYEDGYALEADFVDVPDELVWRWLCAGQALREVADEIRAVCRAADLSPG